ncbi:4-hydroxy-4-methyl-2-oxoglutarate aldolase [Thermus brockianus]|uniref:4-hydroxy-4-methyl-2-oxoglutarate aldolase n=2 Tax=Thermus brockianus TaxID=56956 RepID=A0ABM7XHC2_THEBO|nr:4-hydroxy-4-methyl-2-oxoglutarate aldolase [Thermus brockianus]
MHRLHARYYIPMELSTTDLSDLHPEAVAVPMVFQAFGGKRRFSGRVRTLRVLEDNALVRQVLEEGGEGQVLFVDGQGSLRTALLGGNLARLAWERGWQGVVVHGAVRDAAELKEVPIGILALAATPRKSAKEGKGEVDVPLSLPWGEVVPGSFLVADEDGLLLLPSPPSAGQSGG